MKRYLLLLAGAAVAALALSQPTQLASKAGLANPSRITVITKNSEYPRLNRNGLAIRNFVQGQWI
jgi:hypothetical protein